MGGGEMSEAASTGGDARLPVSLLCGFLGAGKTSLLKHILETKHEEPDFRCAVIVNDMAALNIDKALIDQSALVQSDEVIAMQNGCFCCTLQSDLVEQIVSLVDRNLFNYMVIEASGVSEPSQIAPLFDLCEEEHGPDQPAADHDHAGPQLGEVARLDTCVTLVDSAQFHTNLDTMGTYENGASVGTIAELMMEQVEFANVVVVNKTDLVSEDQKSDILAKIRMLNPKAKIVEAVQSKVDVREIINTGLYNSEDTKEEFWMKATKVAVAEEADVPDCCETSMAEEGKKCCKSKSRDGKLVDSILSQVHLDVVGSGASMTRHEARFGITSFIYRARRPFHPGRLWHLFLQPFFLKMEHDYEEVGLEEGSREKDQLRLARQQEEARVKQAVRGERLGQLLRSKGFIWIATSHDIVGGWQQAGNVFHLKALTPWMGEVRGVWEGTPAADLVLPYLLRPGGEEWEHADRRQELVFIGQELQHVAIQGILDSCLLDDTEMAGGPGEWEQAMAEEDRIHLTYLNVSIKEIE